MEAINYSEARSNFATTIDRVVKNHTPVIITRQKKESVVMMSLEDFKSYEETAYLMQSMKNSNRLNSAIEQLENGKGTQREIIECD